MTSPVNLAYLAGLFDGEGSIAVTRQTRSYGRGAYFCVRASIAMTDQHMVQMYQDLWPATMSLRPFNGDVERRHKDLWKWSADRKKACDFLRDIRPYLRLKHEQADLALEMDSLMSPLQKTDAEYQQMCEIHSRVKVLNQRGC